MESDWLEYYRLQALQLEFIRHDITADVRLKAQFDTETLHHLLSRVKRGEELCPGDIFYLSSYGIWQIILKLTATQLLVRNYDADLRRVQGYTRTVALEPKLTYRLLWEGGSFVRVDWAGHMQSKLNTPIGGVI